MGERTSKFSQVAAASLATLMLVVAVVKAQGCDRPEDSSGTVVVPSTNSTDAGGSSTDLASAATVDAAPIDAGKAESDAPPKGVAEPPAVMPATKSGIFIPPPEPRGSNAFMGATKSAGFIDAKEFGVGIGGLGASTNGKPIGEVGTPTTNQAPNPAPTQQAAP